MTYWLELNTGWRRNGVNIKARDAGSEHQRQNRSARPL
ncbi:hypothetical protein C4K39_1977 [Pseudomonas sessilinigenes]|nr:hypothetical protein C4K39_1977 [Pseudomonas sessilinigenes]